MKVEIKDPVLLLLAVLILHIIAVSSFIAFHAAVEIFGICIAFSIFVIAWNSDEFSDSNYLKLIGIPFIYVAFLDLLHLLYFKGMGIFEVYGDVSTKFLFAARIFVAAAFTSSFISVKYKKNINKYKLFLLYGAATFVIYVIVIYSKLLPDLWLREQGPSEIYWISGITVSVIMLSSFIILCLNKTMIDKEISLYFSLSVIFNLLVVILHINESHYSGMLVYLSNQAKLLSYYFLYSAIVKKGIKEPYKIIFKKLQDSYKNVEKQNEVLKQFAEKDSLTGFFNHRKIFDILENEIKRSERYGSSLTAAMIDIDNFKEINDKYGHLTGDVILASVAEIFKKNMRETDIPGRYGGEEFMVIMPETDLGQAEKAMEKIRKEISYFTFTQNIKLTVSIGIASYSGQDMNHFIEDADKMMYEAKKLGKNRISF